MENGSDNCIYVVFSRTPYRMGRFIRTVTHGIYNHVSIALDGSLCEMYSFARLKRETPFCGGFVCEGAERYRGDFGVADIAVCALPVGHDGYARVKTQIDLMCAHPDAYVYNMLSAALVPLRHRVNVRDSFTCVEFAVSMLRLSGVKLPADYYSIADLYSLFRRYEIYRGEYPALTTADQSYNDDVSLGRNVYASCRQFMRLTFRLVKR